MEKEILSAIATLLAAFMGAWFAFKLEDDRRKEEQKKKNISACIRATFILSKQYDVLSLLQKELIEPIRNNSDKWYHMPASTPKDYQALKFNMDELQFILDTPHKSILSRLFWQEMQFHETINTINIRSQLFLEELQPKMIDIQFSHRTQLRTEIIKALETDYSLLSYRMKTFTNGIIKFLGGKTVKSVKKVRDDFIKVIKDIYSESNPISFDQIK